MNSYQGEGRFAAVNRFFFTPTDTATFGVIRLATAIMAVYIHVIYCYDLTELFGDKAWFHRDLALSFRRDMPVEAPPLNWDPKPAPQDAAEGAQSEDLIYRATWGIEPKRAFDKGQYTWSMWFHITDPTWMAVAHGVVILVMILFALGVWTPVTGTLTWISALSYVNRSHVSLFGMDTMMIIALLYLMIGYFGTRPGAAALTLDRWWSRRRAGAETEAPDTSVTVGFATRMMQIHFCIIYFGAGVSKLLGSSWWNGTALWWTMANYEFAPMDIKLYSDFLIFLCNRRWLWELVTTGGVIYTLTLEVGFPFLIWHRSLRWGLVLAAVFLHTGIALIMGLTGFGIMMLALLLSFVPPETVRQVLGLASEMSPSLSPRPTTA